MSDALESVRVDMYDSVAEVVLIGPGKGNAMGPAFWREFPRTFQVLDQDDRVRAIVVRGSTGNFSYGLDLVAMSAEMGPLIMGAPNAKQRAKLLQLIFDLQRSFNAIANCKKPVIASISGWCIGGGVDLISACDVRVCSREARFSVREVKVAMVADLGSLQRLPYIIGEGHARELALTGKNIDAARAERIGLVNEVFATEIDAVTGARAIATEMANNPPRVVEGIKRVMNFRTDASVSAGLDHVAHHNSAFLPSDDLAEAFAAFAQKREPRFTGG
jgi:enoyl-CoA hydratase